MLMKFLGQILKLKGVTAYRLSRDLNIPNAIVARWVEKDSTQKGFRLDYLVALREWSGMSWEDFGALLDKEFKNKK